MKRVDEYIVYFEIIYKDGTNDHLKLPADEGHKRFGDLVCAWAYKYVAGVAEVNLYDNSHRLFKQFKPFIL